MKHNWEYKRLGTLCDIVRGGSPRPIQEYLTDAKDGLNWIKIGDVASGSKYITTTKEKIKPEGLKKTRKVECGDFILSNSMSFGRPYILKINGCIHDGWLAIKGVQEYFIPDFLFYYLSSPSTYALFEKSAKGGVVNNLNSNIVKGIAVPVPPMAVQQQIVAELDKINEVITDCRELLRNLDALAQSLFHTTFGDPVTNPKRWVTDTIKKVAPSVSSSLFPKEKNGKYWLLNLDQVESQTGRILSIQYFPKEEIGNSTTVFDNGNVLYSKLRPYLNKVITPNNTGFCTTELIPLRPNVSILNREYLTYSLRSKEFVAFINSKTGGAKMPRVKMEHFWRFNIPVPPLALQQQFAAQIEAIEAQKSKVEATIKELQTFLNSRMDYWFN